MKNLIKTIIAAVALACLAVPAVAQDAATPPNDPFFRKPPPKTKVAEERDTNKPVLIPFPPLEQRSQEFLQAKQAARAQGLPEPDPLGQYLVNEVTVTGVFQTERGPGAFVQAGPAGNTFFVYNGTRLYNGEIVSISAGTDFNLGQVVFRELTRYRVKKKETEQVNTVTKAVGGAAARPR